MREKNKISRKESGVRLLGEKERFIFTLACASGRQSVAARVQTLSHSCLDVPPRKFDKERKKKNSKQPKFSLMLVSEHACIKN
jgi:hypothetical protein